MEAGPFVGRHGSSGLDLVFSGKTVVTPDDGLSKRVSKGGLSVLDFAPLGSFGDPLGILWGSFGDPLGILWGSRVLRGAAFAC